MAPHNRKKGRRYKTFRPRPSSCSCFSCHLHLSPVEGGLDKVPGVLEDGRLALVFREDRIEHELLRPVVAFHLHRRLVQEADGSLAVLIQLVPVFFFFCVTRTHTSIKSISWFGPVFVCASHIRTRQSSQFSWVRSVLIYHIYADPAQSITTAAEESVT